MNGWTLGELPDRREGIKPWVHHHHDCALLEADPNRCTCGVGEALRRFWEAEAAARKAGLLEGE